MSERDTLETTVVWNYNMDAAPKDGRVILSVETSWGVEEFDGKYNDDRHAKRPRPYWQYFFKDIGFSRDNPPHAWRLPCPAPPREVKP